MNIFRFFGLLICSLLIHFPAQAQQHGLVMSGPCPNSCRTRGIPMSHCRDWRQGDVCYIEDLSKPPANQPSRPAQLPPRQNTPAQAPANAHGYIIGDRCPHSCRTVGLPKSVCRDWREGDICYIEDLTKPAGRAPLPNFATPFQTPYVPRNPYQQPRPIERPNLGNGPSYGSGQPNSPDYQECRRLYADDVGRPRIDIFRVKQTGNFFGSKYKVRGSVEGVCLVEAGYFEHGRKIQNIPIRTSRDFKRYEFEVIARSDEEPEIRAYNVAGERDLVEIDPNQDNSSGRDRDDDWWRR